MLFQSAGRKMGSAKSYTIVIDPTYYNDGGFYYDSFSSLISNDGNLKKIADEALETNTPIMLEIALVKDTNSAVRNNIIDISNNNFIKSVLLPIIPTSLEFEKTIKAFYKRFYASFNEIDENTKRLGVLEPNLAESISRETKRIKEGLLFFVKEPKEYDINKFYAYINELKANYPSSTLYFNPTLKLLESCSAMADDVVKFISMFKQGDFSKLYYDIAQNIHGEIRGDERQRRVSSKLETQIQANDLKIYIRNSLAYTYHIANEFLSKEAATIRNLSIFEQVNDNADPKTKRDVLTPYGVMLKPRESYDKYVCDTLDITLEAISPYLGVSKENVINYIGDSNGECLYISDPKILEDMHEQSREIIRKMFEGKNIYKKNNNNPLHDGGDHGNDPDLGSN